MRALAEGIKALLEGDENLHSYDGVVPTEPPDLYVVFYLTSPSPRSVRSSAESGIEMYRVTTLYVGTTPNECRWVGERVAALLEGKKPTAAKSVLIRGTAGQVRPDDTINPPAYVCTDVWTVYA